MDKKYFSWFYICLSFLTSTLFAWEQDEDEFLPPDQAFPIQATVKDNTIQVTWKVVEGYYLYKNKIHFNATAITLKTPQFPPGKIKEDEFFGKIEVYEYPVTVTIPYQAKTSQKVTVTAFSQGCAVIGICYPPHKQSVTLTIPASALPVADQIPSTNNTHKTEKLNSKQLPNLSTLLGLDNTTSDEVLPADQAFVFSHSIYQEQQQDYLLLHWDVTPDYYIYKNKIHLQILTPDSTITIGEMLYPLAQTEQDEFFGDIDIYPEPFDIRVPIAHFTPDTQIEVSYQGCAKLIGICYPPVYKRFTLDTVVSKQQTHSSKIAQTIPQNDPLDTTAAQSSKASVSTDTLATPLVSEQDALAKSLLSGNLWIAVQIFFLAGLLLSFTPCVFPMIPILSGIIAGQGDKITPKKAFMMSLIYVLAMACTYTIIGVLAGLSGENIQAWFQTPWILIVFSSIFVILAFSMFGFFHIQLPHFLQNKLTQWSNQQQGGTFLGVVIMGFLSALIVGPCVAPPLVAALIVIGQHGDPVLGGIALFALSIGMGLPLIIIGTSAGKLLPKAGKWMEKIKAIFGVLLLAVAIWMLERIIPVIATLWLWALLLIASGTYMGALEPITAQSSKWYYLWKALGFSLLFYGLLLIIAASSGGKDPLQPLGHFRSAMVDSYSHSTTSSVPNVHPQFTRIKNIAELKQQLAQAAQQQRPVLLDFYADWCISCKEMEKYTFNDPNVARIMQQFTLLQADVSANDAEDKALLKYFHIIGPPAILFFSNNKEYPAYRVVGYQAAADFQHHLNQLIVTLKTRI